MAWHGSVTLKAAYHRCPCNSFKATKPGFKSRLVSYQLCGPRPNVLPPRASKFTSEGDNSSSVLGLWWKFNELCWHRYAWQLVTLVEEVIIVDSKSNIPNPVILQVQVLSPCQNCKRSCGRICQSHGGEEASSFAWNCACTPAPSCWLNNMITCILPDIISWLTLSGIFIRYKCINQCINIIHVETLQKYYFLNIPPRIVTTS